MISGADAAIVLCVARAREARCALLIIGVIVDRPSTVVTGCARSALAGAVVLGSALAGSVAFGSALTVVTTASDAQMVAATPVVCAVARFVIVAFADVAVMRATIVRGLISGLVCIRAAIAARSDVAAIDGALQALRGVVEAAVVGTAARDSAGAQREEHAHKQSVFAHSSRSLVGGGSAPRACMAVLPTHRGQRIIKTASGEFGANSPRIARWPANFGRRRSASRFGFGTNEFVSSVRSCYQRQVPMLDGGRAGGSHSFSKPLPFAPLALLLSLICAFAHAAHAQLPEQVIIAWEDEASCPRPLRLSLESEVARLLGPRARDATPASFDLHIQRLSPAALSPYRLTLTVRSAVQRAEREVELASCAEAQEAAPLLIATAIDPDAALRATPPEPKSAEPTPAEPKPAESKPGAPPAEPALLAEPDRARAREPERDSKGAGWSAWSVTARGLFDLFSLPKPSGGPALGALFSRSRYRLWSEARYLVARRAEAHDGSAAAKVDLFAAALGGAYVWPFGELVVGPSIELELGALHARGLRTAVASPSSQVGPWAAADLGAVAGYGVHRRVGLELSVYAGIPLRRPRLALRDENRDENPFYTTAAMTMRVAVGLRVSLGSR